MKVESGQVMGPGDDVDPFFTILRDLYFSTRRPSLRQCWSDAREIAAEQGVGQRSYDQSKRYIRSLPKAAVLMHREGDKAYGDKAEPFIERDFGQLASNELWCADHHQFDVWVSAGGKLVRPWLTAWQDLRSRMIVGWKIFAHDPNQDVILEAAGRRV